MSTIMSHEDSSARFSPGDLIEHRLFGYRGVVIDVDADFQLSDEWYENVARSRPPRDEPWYHVLVDGARHTTYVAEQNLEADQTGLPIDHPLVGHVFASFRAGRYERDLSVN